jgi:hypothetical protein
MSAAFADKVRGIYISMDTAETTKKFTYLIEKAKATGINTFVVDFSRPSKIFTRNIALLKENNIHYVARIVVFPPHGADHSQMFSEAYWNKKLNLAKQAVDLGAQEVQLDYIRYASTNRPSDQNVHDVHKVIKWFKTQTANWKVPLQIDVFGITSFHEEKRIGQNPGIFASSVDQLNPMVYPSHYEPFREYSKRPYNTVYSSILSLRTQLPEKNKPKLVPYIETYNYRFPLSPTQRLAYITAEIKATEDAKTDGWYAWSANNKYDYLFKVLQARGVQSQSSKVAADEPAISNAPKLADQTNKPKVIDPVPSSGGRSIFFRTWRGSRAAIPGATTSS